MFGTTGNFGIPAFSARSFSLQSLIAQRAAKLNSLAYQQSLNRLATGSRINRGADDPAGLIASQSLRATLAALDAETQANQRASDVAATADGALSQVSDLLTQAKTLVAANANSAGLSAEEKSANQIQINSVVATVDRIANTASFNGQKLLDGNASISASGKSIDIASASSANIGKTADNNTNYTLADLKTGGALATATGATPTASAVVDQAIRDISTQRGQIGAFDKNTLQTRVSTIATSRQQLLTAVSVIADTDYAVEASRSMRLQLLQRSALLTLTRATSRSTISTFSVLA